MRYIYTTCTQVTKVTMCYNLVILLSSCCYSYLNGVAKCVVSETSKMLTEKSVPCLKHPKNSEELWNTKSFVLNLEEMHMLLFFRN